MDNNLLFSLIAWPLILLWAYRYVSKTKSPNISSLRAYLIFLGVLAGGAFCIFFVAVLIVELNGGKEAGSAIYSALTPIIAIGGLFPLWRYANKLITTDTSPKLSTSCADPSAEKTIEYDALDVIRQYGAVLSKPRKATLSLLRDVSELPYPKQVIKAVLRGALQRLPIEEVEPLKAGYILLADFQELTDEARDALAFTFEPLDPELAGMEACREQARRICAAGSCLEPIKALAETERTNFAQDLKSMGFWNEAN